MKNDLYIPESHLVLAELSDGAVRVSLSAHLQSLLGRPTFIDFSAVPDSDIQPNVPFASIETNKTAYDVALPFHATFVAVNPAVASKPEALLDEADGAGWLCEIRPASGVDWRDGLLDEDAYASYIQP